MGGLLEWNDPIDTPPICNLSSIDNRRLRLSNRQTLYAYTFYTFDFVKDN